MQIAIDVGNSQVKVGFFEGSILQHKQVVETAKALQALIEQFNPKHGIIGQVGTAPFAVAEVLEYYALPWQEFTHTVPVPLKNAYQTPDTLGVDRMAAAVGAWACYGEIPMLIVDLGTCVTYEYVRGGVVYEGGAISPGLAMRFKAMAHFTAKLPLLQLDAVPEVLGKSTAACMESGAFHGLRFEIEGMIEFFKNQEEDLRVILTGGDAKIFESSLKANIFVNQNLILAGLNAILLFNVREI